MMILHFTEQTITHLIQKDNEFLTVEPKLTAQRKTVNSSDKYWYHHVPSIGTKLGFLSKDIQHFHMLSKEL